MVCEKNGLKQNHRLVPSEIQQGKQSVIDVSRGERIRTSDLLHPMQAR